MSEFKFNEATHTYTLDGKRMTGVTTALGVIAKPNLIQWAANLATAKAYTIGTVEGLKEKIESYEKIDTSAAKEIEKEFPEFKEARTAHIQKRDKAADAGTDIHKEIEIIIRDVMAKSDGKILDGMTHTEKQVQHFIDWALKNNVKFIASEKKVYSEKLFVAGTYDFKCEIDGKIYLGDIKTSSGIYDRTPFAQVAAYQMLEWSQEPNNVIDGRLIINLKKTGIFDESKDVYFSYDYESDLELFTSALRIYRLLKNY